MTQIDFCLLKEKKIIVKNLIYYHILWKSFSKKYTTSYTPMCWFIRRKNTNNVWDKVLKITLITQIQLLNTEKAYGSKRQFKIVKRKKLKK